MKITRYIKKWGGWRTRLGFYVVVSAEIGKYYGYEAPINITTIGFALMLLGIAYKIRS